MVVLNWLEMDFITFLRNDYRKRSGILLYQLCNIFQFKYFRQFVVTNRRNFGAEEAESFHEHKCVQFSAQPLWEVQWQKDE